MLSQTRDNLGFGPTKKSNSGGHALKFYACIEIWSSVRKVLTRTVKGKKREIGKLCKLETKKNRVRGWDRTVYVPIYHSFGFDNTGACIEYLVEEGHWKGDKTIRAPEFRFKGTKEKLIKLIESKDMERDLIHIVAKVWDEIEEACAVKRKKRY